MEANQRDTPLRRFNTFFWGLALFLVFGIACFVIKNFIHNDAKYDAADEAGRARVLKREQVEKEQSALLSYKKEGNSVQLPPSALFSIAGELLGTEPEDSGVPHNKTFK